MPNITNSYGPEERHYWRRRENPLLAPFQLGQETATLTLARQNDAKREQAFLALFQRLVEACVALEPNEESETILRLKAELDQAQVIAAGLQGDRREVMTAIERLTGLIMAAVRRGAEGDAKALQELADEEEARRINSDLIRWPLVSDLMIPESPIPAAELLATLIGSEEEELNAALWLFTPEQLTTLQDEAEQLYAAIGSDKDGAAPIAAVMNRLRRLNEG